ncbi:MAG: PEGA domain-containing protein [Myxococcota bacterium]|nr:PEGA domain-containing protein [Myxococcota bacterium]
MSERKPGVPPVPDSDADEELQPDWVGAPAQLDPSGRLSSSQPPRRGGPPPRPALPPEDEPLELMERPPPPPPGAEVDPDAGYQALPGRYPSRPRRPLLPIAVGLFVLLLAGAASFVLFGGQGLLPRGWLPRSVQAPPGLEQQVRVLSIDSIPSGAQVLINEVEVGQTPLVRENDYLSGAQVQVRLVRRGYRPWTGTFVGGSEARIEARLVKR